MASKSQFSKGSSTVRKITQLNNDRDAESENGNSRNLATYTVHLPPTPDNQPVKITMERSSSQRVEDQYASSSIFTGGFNQVTSAFMKEHTFWILNITSGFPVWEYVAEVVPMLILIMLAFLLYKATNRSSFKWPWKYTIRSTILSYMLILVHWIPDCNSIGFVWFLKALGEITFPGSSMLFLWGSCY
ncbi:hypothetical protein K1719_035243 [Acacia pycnantha]|nr:hypothetical protein K1719_035243 [Acacia pycnantha]